MTRFPVYVDYDDVLCETARGLAAIAAREYGWRGRFEDVFSFDLGKSFGLETDCAQTLLDRAHEPATLMSLAPVPGSAEGLARLAAAGFEVCIVTGRPIGTRSPSVRWLQRHGMAFDELLFVDKYRRHGEDSAGTLRLEDLALRRFHCAVEDAPSMIRFLTERTQIPVLLFERPWNAELEIALGATGFRLRRCPCWDDVVRHCLA